MIFTELRVALTVPSAPNAKKTARTTSSGSVVKDGSTSRLECITSSVIPTEKCRRGDSLVSSSRTPAAMAGVNSFDDRPYRPPITTDGPASSRSASAVTTSWYRGSPVAPGSLVRSSTATALTVSGRAAAKASPEKGRYSRTVTRPTRSPRPLSASTASSAAPHPEPIMTSTRSASGAPE